MSRRRSTIHDAAALRLHPSGVRVSLPNGDVSNPRSSVVAKKNRKPSLAKRDGLGNWIATDAGGEGRITKRRKLSATKEREPGELEELVGDNSVADADEVPVKVFKDARANRRIAFENDFTFLSGPPQGVDTSLPQPSSDLLKCIHHFASQYYSSRGQLFDSAGQYRKEKKEKRRLKMLQEQASSSEEENDDQEVDPTEEEEEDGPSKSTSKSKNKAKGKPKVKRKTVTQRDMYKAFEGSALLCIGMLLQSQISSTLARRPLPDGWENDFIASDAESVPNQKKKRAATPDSIQRQEQLGLAAVGEGHADGSE